MPEEGLSPAVLASMTSSVDRRLMKSSSCNVWDLFVHREGANLEWHQAGITSTGLAAMLSEGQPLSGLATLVLLYTS